MHLGNLRLRIGVIAIALLVIAVVAIAVGVNSDAPTASATGPTPTKIANDGSLGGVSDILVGDVAANTGLFYCIAKTDHQLSNNEVKTALQCNIDVPGQGATGLTPPPWSDTCDKLQTKSAKCPPGSLNNPSETGPDTIAGPPPPPPYTVLSPSKGYGFFYPAGAGAPGLPSGATCGVTDCTVVTSCFEDVGSPAGLGPNIMSTALILDPKGGSTVDIAPPGPGPEDVAQVSSGSVDIWYNQTNAACKAHVPVGTPDFGGLPLQSIRAYGKAGASPNPNPAPWRVTAPGSILDFDGDGCTDEQELDKNGTDKCGDDPQNPSDSFDPLLVDLSGIYDLTVRVVRADTGVPGAYFFCRVDLQHNTGDNSVEVIPFCYADNPAIEVNPEGYPGIFGDGYSGGPPPGPCNPAGTCAGAFPSPGDDYALADVDANPTVLSGSFDKGTNLITLTGCFEDQDGASALGNVYVELTVSAHQLPGTVDIWIAQPANCAGSPVGLATFENAEVVFAKPNPAKSKGYDQDDDGVPTSRELDSTTTCGHRDPYSPYDYYDVSIPRDGVIDLPNDILGVILHFSPGGYPPGWENWDRGGTITGSAGNWNRHAPDGVIDLPNDILGVILQFNPGGCAATH